MFEIKLFMIENMTKLYGSKWFLFVVPEMIILNFNFSNSKQAENLKHKDNYYSKLIPESERLY